MRSVAFLSSSVNCAESWGKDTALCKLAKIAKVAIVTLGIIALAASMPVLLVASLAADIGLQAMEIAKAAWKGEGAKALSHLGILVIDAFALAAMLTGMWQLMVTAASISAVAMIAIAIKVGIEADRNKDTGGWVDVACYIALSAIGIATAVSTAKLTDFTRETRFSISNRENETMQIIDKNGNIIATVKPGETVNLVLNPNNCFHEGYDLKAVSINANGDITNTKFIGGEIETRTWTYHEPLEPKYFPTVPVSGTVLAGKSVQN